MVQKFVQLTFDKAEYAITRAVVVDIICGTTSSLYNEKPELESHSVDHSLKHCLLVQPEALVNPRSWPLTLEKLPRYAMSYVGLVNSNVVSCRVNLSSQVVVFLLFYRAILRFSISHQRYSRSLSIRPDSSVLDLFFINRTHF